MISPALRLVAAMAGGARLVARPHGVLHVYSGRRTASGRFVPASARVLCRVRTRRLSVIEQASPLLDTGERRMCARCMAVLPVALGRVDARELGSSLDGWKAAYAHLSPAMLRWAGARATTLAESSQVGTVAGLVHGQKPRVVPASRTADQAARFEMHAAIERRRDQLRAAARTVEEIEANRALVADETASRIHLYETETKGRRRDRARTKALRGQYLMPHERDLLNTA